MEGVQQWSGLRELWKVENYSCSCILNQLQRSNGADKDEDLLEVSYSSRVFRWQVTEQVPKLPVWKEMDDSIWYKKGEREKG